MKIGIFGGTFDPVHLGHLLLAETAREVCHLDEIWFIPAWQSPLKTECPGATSKQRMEMLRLAIAGYPPFRVLDLELKRKEISYTIDTLQQLTGQHPENEFSLIIGADSLADLPDWREPERILQLASVIAMNRGQSPASLDAVKQQLGAAAAETIQIVQMPAIEISATDLRRRTAEGRSIRYQTLRAVEQYIQQHGIYTKDASEHERRLRN